VDAVHLVGVDLGQVDQGGARELVIGDPDPASVAVDRRLGVATPVVVPATRNEPLESAYSCGPKTGAAASVSGVSVVVEPNEVKAVATPSPFWARARAR